MVLPGEVPNQPRPTLPKLEGGKHDLLLQRHFPARYFRHQIHKHYQIFTKLGSLLEMMVAHYQSIFECSKLVRWWGWWGKIRGDNCWNWGHSQPTSPWQVHYTKEMIGPKILISVYQRLCYHTSHHNWFSSSLVSDAGWHNQKISPEEVGIQAVGMEGKST